MASTGAARPRPSARAERLEAIRTALAADRFVLHYQPQVELRTGTVLGFEALIRWQHPERGLLPPAAFIPDLQEHPLAIAVGDWVIRTALAQLDTWGRMGLVTSVNVNVDAVQLHDPGFPAHLEELLAAHPDLHPARLTVEIDEASTLEDLDDTVAVVRELRALGVGIALDDVGTGSSPLTSLTRLDAPVVKIDRSLVLDLLTNPEHALALHRIVGLTTSLQRAAIAEGIETELHGQLLLELGFDRGQGYGIARPLPAEAVTGWVHGWSPPSAWGRTPRLVADRIPALIAEITHNAWFRSIHDHLRGQKERPELDEDACGLGRWLSTQLDRTEVNDPLRGVAVIHTEAHRTARRICADVATGHHGDLDALLEVMDRTSRRLVAELQTWRHRDGTADDAGR